MWERVSWEGLQRRDRRCTFRDGSLITLREPQPHSGRYLIGSTGSLKGHYAGIYRKTTKYIHVNEYTLKALHKKRGKYGHHGRLYQVD